MGGEFVLVGGVDEFAFFFLDVGKQVVKLGGVLLFEKRLDELAGFGETADEEIGESEVVTVFVGHRIDALRGAKISDRFGKFACVRVEFTEIVIGVKVLRFELSGSFEMSFGLIELTEAGEVGGEIGLGSGGTGLEADSFFEMLRGLDILGLRGIDQAEELMDLEAFWDGGEELFELRGGFGVMSRVVLGYGGLEVAIEAVGGSRSRGLVGRERR